MSRLGRVVLLARSPFSRSPTGGPVNVRLMAVVLRHYLLQCSLMLPSPPSISYIHIYHQVPFNRTRVLQYALMIHMAIHRLPRLSACSSVIVCLASLSASPWGALHQFISRALFMVPPSSETHGLGFFISLELSLLIYNLDPNNKYHSLITRLRKGFRKELLDVENMYRPVMYDLCRAQSR